MPRTNSSAAQWLNGLVDANARKAVNALVDHKRTGYVAATTTTTQSNTTMEPLVGMSVDVPGNAQVRVWGRVVLSIGNAAHNIKFDFNAGTATIVTSSMGGDVSFNLTAVAATRVPVTALNTSASGATTNAWTSADFDFVCTTAVAGTIAMNFAQAASGATNSSALVGSYICAEPLDHVVNT